MMLVHKLNFILFFYINFMKKLFAILIVMFSLMSVNVNAAEEDDFESLLEALNWGSIEESTTSEEEDFGSLFWEEDPSDNEEEESVVKLFEKVLLKMYQIKDTDKIVKDSAYCDEIVKGKAIATIIENKKDKKAIKKDPFENLYLVDIETVRADGEVKLYRVTKLHNIVPNED